MGMFPCDTNNDWELYDEIEITSLTTDADGAKSFIWNNNAGDMNFDKYEEVYIYVEWYSDGYGYHGNGFIIPLAVVRKRGLTMNICVGDTEDNITRIFCAFRPNPNYSTWLNPRIKETVYSQPTKARIQFYVR